MTTRSTVHDSFRIERHFDAAPERVFRAFADPAAKAKWFGGPEEAKREEAEFDFREGGRENMVSFLGDGSKFSFTAVYTDIVPDERIVYTYEMSMNDQRISVSVATIEIRGARGGSDFVLVEQGVYLDGLDSPEQRRLGTEQLMDALAKALAA